MSQRILVIDDDEAVRLTVQLLLERHGYKIGCATNGAEGLDMIEAFEPDLVITDIIMPMKEGIETIREIRRLHPAVKIIAMSGGGRLTSVSVLELASKFGADDVVHKPFLSDGFLAAVRRVLDCTIRGNGVPELSGLR
jgi:DNA-binding response OmpR family regulator